MSVGIGWNRQSLKNLRKHWAGTFSKKHVAPATAPDKSPPKVYVSLPRRNPDSEFISLSTATSASCIVYSQLPQKRNSSIAFIKRPNKAARAVWQLLPIAVLVATIFASIGMLRILVQGVQITEYYPAGYLKTQSWRGGAGPAPQDAIKSEYQNALTREMVAAVDTGVSKVVAPEKKKKAKTDSRIKLTASRYQSSVKKGLHNLKLKVFNGTPSTLDKVIVEVDFLGKKGKLLQTELYTTPPVGPHQERVITIPEGTPGLKVAYRIREVRSRKHVTQLYSL